MVFTDRSDLFAALNEEGINFVVRHVMRQRPSLFNYGTLAIARDPSLACRKIDATDDVRRRGNPLVTIEDPLPILGTDGRLGLDFCVQLTEARVDFHPGNAIALPPELDPLAPQRFALQAQACAGLGCPPDDIVEQLERRQLGLASAKQSAGPFGLQSAFGVPKGDQPSDGPRPPAIPLPHKGLECFCLDLFVVGHFETQGDLGGAWLRPRLDGLEIVDIGPKGLESAIECYLSLALRLGVLPQLAVAIGKAVLNLVAELPGIIVSAPVTAAIPFNPAIEDDSLKVFLDFEVAP